jgi:PAS domain S-box-containing protein
MAEKGTHREKVLVVDDERLTCEIVSEVLSSENCLPHICTLPGEALDAAKEQNFALAFIDINMPGMDGIHLAKHIRERDPFCDIIMMTGYASIDNAIQAIKIGATDYLRKPFSACEIVLCIGRYRERKALREMISKAEQRYHRLVQNVPMLIFRLRRDTRLDFVNQACLPILGYTPQEAVRELDWLMERIHLEDRERVGGLLKSAFESEQSTQTAECRLMHKEDRLIYALIKCISNTGCTTEDETECIEGIIVDITDRVLLEKALVQREKLKTLGAIAAEVAHEIRNPLVSIGGFARRLQKRLPDAHEAGIILRESERLERLLGRIRNYLAPVEIQLQDCSINDIVSNCVELLSPEIRRREVVCRLDLSTDLPQIAVDPDILAEVCINLIRNALAAMEKRGALVIKTFETEQNLLIDFKNELGAVKLKQPEHLFLPLDEGGESIGLPLSYRLLKNMGGLLSFVEKENQVIFTVSIPKRGEPARRNEHSLPFLELVE